MQLDHQLILAQVLIHFEQVKHSAAGEGQCSAEQTNLPKTQLSIYFAGSEQMRKLNHDYRGKNKLTNVLSFASDMPAAMLAGFEYTPLGELVFSFEVLKREALEQNKTLVAHYTHLLVHGCLHLLGMDHETSQADQERMEALEVCTLEALGISNPY